MSKIERRAILKMMGFGASVITLPGLISCSIKESKNTQSITDIPKDFYNVPMQGQARILHMADVHGQLKPVYFREPNVNLGVGDAYAKPPHIVGKDLLSAMKIKPGTVESYAYSYIDFETSARAYGQTGGYAHIKTLLNQLRGQAGGKDSTLTLDSGDLWQGSGTSLWTRGIDMVEASNLLELDVMVGHWEFTYRENEVLNNVALFKGDFIGQNVRVKEESLFDENYEKLVEQYDGRGLYDEDEGYAFQPYVIKVINGKRICIVGQAFPRTGNANAQEFFPDWSFGLREDDMVELVEKIKQEENPDAIVLLSHNGMDVDIKMAQRIPGLNAVFGGHTHDGMPQPVKVKNISGNTCLVTNAGSNGKYVGVMDFDFKNGNVEMTYNMLPIITNWLPANKEMQAYIDQMRSTVYDKNIVESRNKKRFYNPSRLGKSYETILSEKLAKADRLLYRRGNFMGTWDQILCNALREEYSADIAMSAGVRWGVTTLKNDWITMEDVMSQCAMTYAETYVTELSGEELINTIEGVADNLFDENPYLQSGGDMVRLGGMDYTIKPSNPLGQRITEARLDNGELIQKDKKYTIAGWASVNQAPEGRLMWDVVRDYILNKKSKDNILHLEKINHPKLLGVSRNPGIADYPGKLG
jgi:sulfur-oxidizing protein SoxB